MFGTIFDATHMSDFNGDQTLTKVFLSPELPRDSEYFLSVGSTDRAVRLCWRSSVFSKTLSNKLLLLNFTSANFVPNSIGLAPILRKNKRPFSSKSRMLMEQ
jgi:hypothetical protein